MITIKDVAKACGVSTSTVSIVINGQEKKRHLSPVTVERIKKTMATLNYVPSRAAREMRGVTRPTLALMWVLDRRSNFFMRLVRGIKLMDQIDLVILPYENGNLLQALQKLKGHEYSGLLIGALNKEDLDTVHSYHFTIPVCLLNRSSERFSCVYTDPKEIAEKAVEVLKKRGCRSLGVCEGYLTTYPVLERRRCVIEACRREGILVLERDMLSCSHTIVGGTEAASYYLYRKDAPDAVYLDNEMMALGFFIACMQKDDQHFTILASGINDPDIGQEELPGVYNLDIPGEEIAKRGAEILLSQVEGGEPVAQKVDSRVRTF